MKSVSVGSLNATGLQRLKTDLAELFGLPEKVLAELPKLAYRVGLCGTQPDAVALRTQAASELHIPRSQLASALRIAEFLLIQLAPGGDGSTDKPEDLAEDIREAGQLPPETTQSILRFVSELKNLATEDITLTELRRSHHILVIPALNSIESTAEFRAVFRKPYELNDDVSTYTPECIDLLPVGVIKLEFTGDSKDVSFQVSKRSLQLLSDSLAALKKNLEAAEQCITFKRKDDLK